MLTRARPGLLSDAGLRCLQGGVAARGQRPQFGREILGVGVARLQRLRGAERGLSRGQVVGAEGEARRLHGLRGVAELRRRSDGRHGERLRSRCGREDLGGSGVGVWAAGVFVALCWAGLAGCGV